MTHHAIITDPATDQAVEVCADDSDRLEVEIDRAFGVATDPAGRELGALPE